MCDGQDRAAFRGAQGAGQNAVLTALLARDLLWTVSLSRYLYPPFNTRGSNIHPGSAFVGYAKMAIIAVPDKFILQ